MAEERTIIGEFELTRRKGRRFWYARAIGTNRYRSLGTDDRGAAEAELRASLADLGAIRTARTAENVTVKEVLDERTKSLRFRGQNLCEWWIRERR